jgi:hypothetical protein
MLLRSNVDTALAVITALLIERIVHAGIIEILIRIVRFNTLEDTKGAESCRNNYGDDDADNSTSSETDSEDLVLAKNGVLVRA